MTITVRGITYQENMNNDMSLEFEFYDLSHLWGLGQPCWRLKGASVIAF